jgi:hypothetical protein
MKIPVTFHPSLGEWFDLWYSGPLEKDRIDLLMANEVLCVSTDDFRKQASLSATSENKSHLYDLKKYVSWTITDKPVGEVKLSADAETSEKAEQLTKVNQKLSLARAEIKISEPRELTFDRKFRSLCEKAKRIEIFDQYAAVSIGLANPGAIWFIESIVRVNPNVSIAIYCLDVKDSRLARGFNERVAEVRESLAKVLINQHTFQGELRVIIGPEEKIRMHDRRFSFRFDSGVTNVNVGSGLGIFSSAYSQDSHTVDLSHYSSNDTIRKITEDFTSQIQNVGQVALRHLDVCNFCT